MTISYEEAANQANTNDKNEIKRFELICLFLRDHPDLLSWRGNNKPDVLTQNGINILAKKFFQAKNKNTLPAAPTTVPDEAVSIVMMSTYNYSSQEAERIKIEHQHSMSSENIVGTLLERYIAEILEPHGWVWCAGDFVRGVDFIKYNNQSNTWKAVQVKNRDNTENSSSSAIRAGTDTKKWFRIYSKTGKDNWNNFPEEEFNDILTEDGFQSFIRNYFSNIYQS